MKCMNKAIIVGAIIAIAVGIAVVSAISFNENSTESDSLPQETVETREPMHFTVDLKESVGVQESTP